MPPKNSGKILRTGEPAHFGDLGNRSMYIRHQQVRSPLKTYTLYALMHCLAEAFMKQSVKMILGKMGNFSELRQIQILAVMILYIINGAI
jgi:hypothetical protein